KRHDAPLETHGDDYLRAMVGAEENLFFALRTACIAEDFAGAATLLIAASPYWGRSAQYGRIAQSMSLLLEESRLQRFDAEIRAQLFRAAGRFAFGRGEWTEAIRLDLLAARTFEEIGKPYNALMARLAANVAGANTGTPIEERIEEHKNILARHMELGVGPPWVAGELQSDLSAMYKTLGQTQTALDYALSALELLRLHGRRGREAMLLTIVTRIYCELGATGKAQECAHEAIRILGDIGEEATLGEAYRNLALAQMAAGLPESEVFTTLLAALSLHSRRQEARFTLFAVDACLEAFLKYGYVRQAARAVGHVLSLRERTNYNRPGDLFPSAAVCSATQQAVGADYSTLVGLGRLDSLVELQEELRRLVSGSPREEPDKETIAS
ncbi:MAG TPA: hypothetical protein VFN37_11005, partial [Candidatus Baltobacteraceae bacterium]|nr:hypothetical protein [Candidatus Baltobacteraceae bacterium]